MAFHAKRLEAPAIDEIFWRQREDSRDSMKCLENVCVTVAYVVWLSCLMGVLTPWKLILQ